MGAVLSLDAAASMGRFLGEFFPPDLSRGFVHKVLVGTGETLAMSVLGTLLAFHMGLFQMGKTATILAAMMLMVALVDAASHLARWLMTQI